MKIKHNFKFGPSLLLLCLYSSTFGDSLHLQVSISCFALVFVLVPRIPSFLHLISTQAFLKVFTSLLLGPTFKFIISTAEIHSSSSLAGGMDHLSNRLLQQDQHPMEYPNTLLILALALIVMPQYISFSASFQSISPLFQAVLNVLIGF